jgi:hypothetical protein
MVVMQQVYICLLQDHDADLEDFLIKTLEAEEGVSFT